MVVKARIVRKRSFYNGLKGFKVLASNVNKRTFAKSYEQAKDIRKLMRRVVKNFKDTGELYESIKITPERNKLNSRVTLYTDSSDALYNELGVKPHWVKVNREKKNYNSISIETSKGTESLLTKEPEEERLQRWIDKKLPNFSKKWFLVGGWNSRIRKGNSMNRFFKSSIDAYLKGTRSRSQYAKALREAIRDSFK